MKADMEEVRFESGETSRDATSIKTETNKGISILDLILRFLATGGTFGSAIAMGTTDQTLAIFPQFTQVSVKYNDFPSFTFFVVANSIVCAYVFLSLPLSILRIISSGAKISRIILVIFDTVMLALVTAGASAAASIVYLAHEGNGRANWLGFCQQFDSFCERISGALIGSFASMIVFILIIIESAVAISRR